MKKSVFQIVRQGFRGYGIEVKPVSSDDIEILRLWRNSKSIRERMYDKKLISAEKQKRWYSHVQTTRQEAHWVVWCNGVRTGWMKIKAEVPLDVAKTVDVGMYVGDSSVKHGLLGFAMGLMQIDIVFDVLSIPKIEMTINEDNPQLLRFNNVLGYQETVLLNGYRHMCITPNDYQPAKAKLLRIFEDDGIVAIPGTT